MANKRSTTTSSIAGQLLATMLHECNVIKHLATKIPKGGMSYRPTKGQRSTLQLLRYLPYCAANGVVIAVKGTSSFKPLDTLKARAAKVTQRTFSAAMDEQAALLTGMMKPLTDRELATKPVTLFWGAETRLGHALSLYGAQCLTAYRMQLFLYAKAAGNHELNSWDCWVGAAGEKDL